MLGTPKTRQARFGEPLRSSRIIVPKGVTGIDAEAFYGCTGLTSIKYCGTAEQWNAISKGDDWAYNTGSYIVTYNYTEEE